MGPESTVPSGRGCPVCWDLKLILSHPPSLGWESAVSILQNHLWGEDWNAAVGEDGGVQVPHVPPRPRRLWDYTHCLQHPSWHPGEGPGQCALTTCTQHRVRITLLEECWGVEYWKSLGPSLSE